MPMPEALSGRIREALCATWFVRRAREERLADAAALAAYQVGVRLRLREIDPALRPCRRAPRVLRLAVTDLHGLRVERLAVEIAPDRFVPCDLFASRPAGPLRPAPAAIICADRAGRASPHAVAIARVLAAAGWTVLSSDPIGSGARRGSEDRESLAIEALWTAVPGCAPGIEEAIRLADYVVHLPGVDPRRVALAGIGGGAGFALAAAALDPRIRAAAAIDAFDPALEPFLPPAWIASSPEGTPLEWACETIDAVAIACAIAPRPLLLACDASRAGAAAVTRGAAEWTTRAYARAGRGAAISFHAGLWRDRARGLAEEVASWLERTLGRGLAPAGGAGDLGAPPGGGGFAGAPGLRRRVQASARASVDRALSVLPANGAERIDALRGSCGSLLAALAGGSGATVEGIDSLRLDYEGAVRVEELEARLAGGERVGIRLLSRGQPTDRLLAMDRATPGTAENEAELQRVQESGWTVALIGTRARGSAPPPARAAAGGTVSPAAGAERWGQDAAAACAGRSVVVARALWFRLALRALERRHTFRLIVIAGRGETALIALLAAAQGNRCDAVILEKPAAALAVFAGSGRSASVAAVASTVIPGILAVADIPDLAALLAPRRLWILDPQGPEGRLPFETAAAALQRAVAAYAALGASSQIEITDARPWTECLRDLSPGADPKARVPEMRLRPSPAAPRTLEFQGRPVFLAAAGRTAAGIVPLEGHAPDALAAAARAGGNLLSLAALAGEGLAPWRRDATGPFDASAHDERYFARIEALLASSLAAGTAVLIELFPCREERWPIDGTWLDPRRARGVAASDVPPDGDLYRAIPALGGAGVGRRLEALVRKLIATAAPYPNVLFSIGTASRAPLSWSQWWADFVRREARGMGIDIAVGEGPPPESESPGIVEAILRDPRFAFADLSASIGWWTGLEDGPPAWALRAAYQDALDLIRRARGVSKPLLFSSIPPDARFGWTLAFAGAAGVRAEVRATGGARAEALEADLHELREFLEGASFQRLLPRPELLVASPPSTLVFVLGAAPSGPDVMRSVLLLILDASLGPNPGGRVELRFVAGPLRATQSTPGAAPGRPAPAGPSPGGSGVVVGPFDGFAVVEIGW
ncbi:MAG: acetylxylan esterase [Planctomycetes bacterium]|nr:acetylxylan esterase [Planctomycetota bacterium]